ncbi:fibrillin-2-like [Mytilus trossulus]|uniref:fibrillin-2-like n=1 Tax=Mytilus trossulus TaxID=6551 RepID=UPI0030050F5F
MKMVFSYILLLLFEVFRIIKSAEDTPSTGCETPPAPINGNFTVFGDNLLVEYMCNDGFYMYGERYGACISSEQKWTEDPPKCLAYDCPDLQPPSRGFVKMERNNSIARFSCKRRFYLMGGESTLFCLGNRWSGYSPLCAGSTVKSSSLGRQVLRNYTAPKEKMWNFDDTLRASDQTCSRFRSIAPPEVEHASFKTDYVYNEARRAWSSIANYTCDDGYSLVTEKNKFMLCRNYRWFAPTRPKCKKDIEVYYPCRESRCGQVCIPGYNRRYACGCNRGYRLASDSYSCQDVNECLSNNGRCDHICYNRIGSRLCVCRDGYLKVGDRCIDDDECKAGIHNCPGQCINTEGSYLCNCTGIPGYLPGENRPCKDLNECEVDNGGCEDVCINTRSSYKCRCKQKGYLVSPDRHNCSDRDECQRYGKKICHNGHCVNIPGSFYCECNMGYRFHKPSKQCIDTNECKDNNGGCEDECVNTIGSFYCVCNHPGLQDNNGTCVDINECEVDTDGCEDICINSHGSYHCVCEKYGYIIHSNGRNCTTCKPTEYMIDEKKLCVPCHPNSHAKGFNSSSYNDCECNEGFVGSPLDNVLCEDIDECATGELVCEYGCVNTAGSAHCICPDGYSVHNVSACIDTNECAENGTICGGLCRNFDGYYECFCDVGYRMANDSYTCDDIDECSEGYNCSHRCINTIGGVQCSCYEGYDLVSDNTSCTDINECEREQGMKCEDQCLNLEGYFKCECTSPGLKLSWDGVSCSDINECQEGVNFCDDVCINTHGSYDCKCEMTGYGLAADGRGCEDFNECLSPLTNDCQQICNNYESSYNCSCPPGYIQTSDTNCEACPVGSYHDVEKDTCIRCPIWSTTSGKGTPSMAGCDCIDGYVGNISMAIPCKDKNECEEEDNFGCEQQCQNMEGYAYCSCQRGYNLHKNKKNCTDLDECKYQNHFCADLCENSIGSYSCSCRKGFELYTDKKYCVDINECYGDGKPCDEDCENTWGSYRCACLTQGHVLAPDGHTCIKNRPKFSCPEDVLVKVKDGAIEVKVELPSDIFSNDLYVDPGWIKRVSQFPLGETVVMVTSLYTNSDGDPEILCSFTVTVDHV